MESKYVETASKHEQPPPFHGLLLSWEKEKQENHWSRESGAWVKARAAEALDGRAKLCHAAHFSCESVCMVDRWTRNKEEEQPIDSN